LAKGLGVPEEEVFAVARGKTFWSAGTCHRFVRRLDYEPCQEAVTSPRTPKYITGNCEMTYSSYFRELPRERQDDFMRIAHTLHREHSVKALSPQKNKLTNKKSS